jgi:hypothetical protein
MSPSPTDSQEINRLDISHHDNLAVLARSLLSDLSSPVPS